MCWIKNFSSYTHALPTKGHLLSTPNHNSSLYTLTHAMQQKDITVTLQEINNTPALVRHWNHILNCTILGIKGSQVFKVITSMLCTKCMLWMFSIKLLDDIQYVNISLLSCNQHLFQLQTFCAWIPRVDWILSSQTGFYEIQNPGSDQSHNRFVVYSPFLLGVNCVM